MKASTRATFVALICLSFTLFVVITMLEAGYDNTAYETEDSQGNRLGFNNRVTPELYGIVFRNADWFGFCKKLGWYGSLYLLMHLFGLLAVMTAKPDIRNGWRKNFFAMQLVLFPFGWAGVIAFPFFVVALVTGTVDGEIIVEGLSWVIQPVWFAISIALILLCPKTKAKSLSLGTVG